MFSIYNLSAFSKSNWTSDEISDVHVVNATIVKNQYVVYQVNAVNIKKRASFARWTLLKRFSDFTKLHESLVAAITTPSILQQLPPLPPKQMKQVIDHFHPRFVEKRRILLDLFMRTCISIQPICDHPLFLQFVGCGDKHD
jgi:hypothetical protein